MPSRRVRNPLVLVSTAVAVDDVLTRSCSRAGQEKIETTSVSKRQLDSYGNSGIALTAGLLLWNGTKRAVECCSGKQESSSLTKLLERRGGGNEVDAFDELTTVGVSASFLRQVSLSSGAWVIVQETSRNLARPARVLVLDPPGNCEPTQGSFSERSSLYGLEPPTLEGFPVYNLISDHHPAGDDVAYLSPVLAFNLGIHVSWIEFLTSSPPSQKDADESSEEEGKKSTARRDILDIFSPLHFVTVSPFISILESPLSENTSLQNENLVGSRGSRARRIKYASHMRIGMVKVPGDSLFHPPSKGRQAEIDRSLQEFFRLPRFLAKGDIFSVEVGNGHGPVDGHLALYRASRDEASNREQLIFKVLALEPSTEPFLCVSHNHTALILGGSAAAQLPPLSSSSRLHKYFLRAPAVRQLAHLLAPCLHPQATTLPLRIAILIHGPSGSGKQTAVRLAAEGLGVHVVAFNCYDFVGATEGKTSAALVEAFKTAKRYSPSVLLLRRFEALAKSSSGGSSPLDQQGSVSRITSVLKTCVHNHLPSTLEGEGSNTSLWMDGDDNTDVYSAESGSVPVKALEMGLGRDSCW